MNTHAENQELTVECPSIKGKMLFDDCYLISTNPCPNHNPYKLMIWRDCQQCPKRPQKKKEACEKPVRQRARRDSNNTVYMAERLTKSIRWLDENGIEVISYNGSAHSLPIVFVKSTQKIYSLFARDGVRKRLVGNKTGRYEDWEAIDALNQVVVRWTEVLQ